MNNGYIVIGLVILTVIFLLAVIGVIFFILNQNSNVVIGNRLIVSPNSNTNTNSNTNSNTNTNSNINTILSLLSGSCNPANIGDNRFEPCFLLNTNIQNTARFYDSQTDMTIATINPETVPSAQEICLQFCNSYELPTTCNDVAFSNCVNTFSTTCPIAKNNLINYYAIGRGKISCFPSSTSL